MENEKIIINKLNGIKAELDYLRSYLEDITLTKDDCNALEEANKDLKLGRTKRL